MPYEFETLQGTKLDKEDLRTSIDLLAQGGAVSVQFARSELPRALMVVLARSGPEIVGVGVVKQKRPVYNQRIKKRSGWDLPKEMHELGYVSIGKNHQGKGLSSEIVGKLVHAFNGALFATTGNSRMKRTLANCGFVEVGHHWDGHTGPLSLWMRQ